MVFITRSYEKRVFRKMSGPPSQPLETNILVLPAGLSVRLRFFLNPQSLEEGFF